MAPASHQTEHPDHAREVLCAFLAARTREGPRRNKTLSRASTIPSSDSSIIFLPGSFRRTQQFNVPLERPLDQGLLFGRHLPISLFHRFCQPGKLQMRSEEHTSELQSHHDLVCRLLLEKKKIQDGL